MKTSPVSYQMFLKARTSGEKPQKPIQEEAWDRGSFLHLGPSSSSRMVTASAPKRHWGTARELEALWWAQGDRHESAGEGTTTWWRRGPGHSNWQFFLSSSLFRGYNAAFRLANLIFNALSASDIPWGLSLKEKKTFLARLRGMWDLSSPTQGSNLCPLQWKRGVLTTEPPGKFLFFFLPWGFLFLLILIEG